MIMGKSCLQEEEEEEDDDDDAAAAAAAAAAADDDDDEDDDDDDDDDANQYVITEKDKGDWSITTFCLHHAPLCGCWLGSKETP
nr:unnamed protein product [Spirometra erinaceieuropaei]